MTRLGLVAVVATIALTGCTGRIHFEKANRDASHTQALQRVVVVSHLGEFGEGFNKKFAQEVVSRLSERGVEATVFTITHTDLNPEATASQIESFGPDAVLVLRQTKGVIQSSGSETGWFVAKLHTDLGSAKAIWATEFSILMTIFDSYNKTGRKLARKLFEELSNSELI